MNIAYYKSPVGTLEIAEDNGFVTGLRVVSELSLTTSQNPIRNELLAEATKQLNEYFSGIRFDFDLPLRQEGTPFQQSVWEFLKTIPYGKTVSYKEEAEAINRPKAVRAIGSANGSNKIAIIVPCHRVINSSGELGGYAYGLPIKRVLLEMERRFTDKE